MFFFFIILIGCFLKLYGNVSTVSRILKYLVCFLKYQLKLLNPVYMWHKQKAETGKKKKIHLYI